VLTELGDAEGALENYQAGLAAADKSLQRVSTTLDHMLDRADVLEAMGQYSLLKPPEPRWLKLAGPNSERKLGTRRNVAASYAARRET